MYTFIELGGLTRLSYEVTLFGNTFTHNFKMTKIEFSSYILIILFQTSNQKAMHHYYCFIFYEI